MIRVVHKRPGLPAEVVLIDGSLESLQRLLDGGYLEIVYAPALWAFHAYVDEEGKLKGLAPNFTLGYDVVVGPVIFSKSDARGDEVGLDEREALNLCARLNA